MHINYKKFGFPVLLLIILIFPLFFGEWISPSLKSILYSISLSMKAVLLAILPFLIFSFIFSSVLNLKSGIIRFIVLLISMAYISNCLAIFMGFAVGSLTLPHLSITPHIPLDKELLLKPIWELHVPLLFSNQTALLTGFILGLVFSFKKFPLILTTAKFLNSAANLFLKRLFVPLLPLFILGFVFKLEHDQLLEIALKTFAPVFFIVISTQITYLLFLYLAVSKFSIKTTFDYIKNVIPATITGFSTLSSAATMPILILCTEKNLPKPEIAEMVIPATINTHTIGSAIGITMLSLTTMVAFGHPLPSFLEFFEFGLFYALAKFAVAAVPGGGIIVAAPLLVNYFGFTSEMVGLITAFYILLDPFGTAANVTGNGFFALAFSKIYKT